MVKKRNGLKAAIALAGSQSALARLLNVNQQNVYNWLHSTRKGVPAEYVLPIEKATGVSRHDLRPDLYPREEATQ